MESRYASYAKESLTDGIVAVMPLGYPSEKSRASYLHRTRKPLEQTTFLESYPKADGDGEGDEADA